MTGILPVRAALHAYWLVLFLVNHPSEARYLPAWVRSRLFRSTPMDDAMPFLSFRAIAWLDRIVDPGAVVFEFGTGGSSLFLARRAAQLVSTEHAGEWYETARRIRDIHDLSNWTLLLREPQEAVPSRRDPADPGAYVSAFESGSFERYARSIDDYPDGEFDLVLVDGRARPSCVQHAIAKVKRGGYLLVDDYDRPYYASALRLLSGWRQTDLTGLVAYHWGMHYSKAWRKPA